MKTCTTETQINLLESSETRTDDSSITTDIISPSWNKKTRSPNILFINLIKKLNKYIVKAPFFVLFISLIQIIIFLVGLHTESLSRALIFDPEKQEQVWRFVTYIFLHNGSLHLLMNVIIQLLLAVLLELEQGSVRTGIIYIGGGISGSLGASFTKQEQLAGASAAVYALLTSHIAHISYNFHSIKHGLFRLFAVILLIVADTAFTIYHLKTADNNLPKIGWLSHLAGADTGLFLGLIIFKGTSDGIKPIRIIAVIKTVILIAYFCLIRFF